MCFKIKVAAKYIIKIKPFNQVKWKKNAWEKKKAQKGAFSYLDSAIISSQDYSNAISQTAFNNVFTHCLLSKVLTC